MPYTGYTKREYQRKWVAARRLQGLEYLGGCCVKCGSTERLEVDHKDPTEKWSHRIWSYSWKRIYAELDKCRLLCRVCHEEKSKTEVLVGSAQPQAKLTEHLVRQARERYSLEKISLRSLAAEYGVTYSPMRRAIKGEGWTHVC